MSPYSFTETNKLDSKKCFWGYCLLRGNERTREKGAWEFRPNGTNSGILLISLFAQWFKLPALANYIYYQTGQTWITRQHSVCAPAAQVQLDGVGSRPRYRGWILCPAGSPCCSRTPALYQPGVSSIACLLSLQPQRTPDIVKCPLGGGANCGPAWATGLQMQTSSESA